MIQARSATDQKLLIGLLAADAAAVKRIYDLALPSVIHWVKENNGSEADARDLFQEALLSLFRRLEQGNFELTCALKSYLRIICRNLWLTRLRQQKRVQQLSELEEAIELDDSIQLQIEQSEQRQLFLKHFDRLSDSCRQILALFFEKTPLQTIADRLNTSLGYIKKRKFQCKEKLVEAVQNDPLYQEFINR